MGPPGPCIRCRVGGGINRVPWGVLRFAKFRQEMLDPIPGRDVYAKRPAGRGWPEECPPIRAANAYGFDCRANYDVTLAFDGDVWKAEPAVEVASDFDWSPDEEVPGRPLVQRAAWFWERGQTLPHAISDDVWPSVRDQAKLSTFLFLETDPNEILLMQDVPWRGSDPGFRVVPAVIETDWYAASYPWHVVLQLDPARSPVTIRRGDVLCRLTPLQRAAHFARPMSGGEFGDFFDRAQRWVATHGSETRDPGVRDLRKTYVRQQVRPAFKVLG